MVFDAPRCFSPVAPSASPCSSRSLRIRRLLCQGRDALPQLSRRAHSRRASFPHSAVPVPWSFLGIKALLTASRIELWLASRLEWRRRIPATGAWLFGWAKCIPRAALCRAAAGQQTPLAAQTEPGLRRGRGGDVPRGLPRRPLRSLPQRRPLHGASGRRAASRQLPGLATSAAPAAAAQRATCGRC